MYDAKRPWIQDKVFSPPEADDGDGAAAQKPKRTGGKGDGWRKRNLTKWRWWKEFRDYSQSGLSPSEQAIWFTLWGYARLKRGALYAKTAQSALVRDTGLSKSTIAHSVARLKSLGLVGVARRGSPKTGITIYRIHSITKGENETQPKAAD